MLMELMCFRILTEGWGNGGIVVISLAKAANSTLREILAHRRGHYNMAVREHQRVHEHSTILALLAAAVHGSAADSAQKTTPWIWTTFSGTHGTCGKRPPVRRQSCTAPFSCTSWHFPSFALSCHLVYLAVQRTIRTFDSASGCTTQNIEVENRLFQHFAR